MAPKVIYRTAFFCAVFACICMFLAFVTPWWIISWPRVHSGFKRLGLWEACFAGNVIPNDPQQVSYHGCWWILATEYWNIRSWLMPPWFIIVQILCTFAMIIHMVTVLVMLLFMLKCCKTSMDGCLLNSILALIWSNTILTSAAVIVFASRALFDYTWMPEPNLNYLSWSYGLAVLSAFFSIFAGIAVTCFAKIYKQEMKAPPKNPNMLPMVPKV